MALSGGNWAWAARAPNPTRSAVTNRYADILCFILPLHLPAPVFIFLRKRRAYPRHSLQRQRPARNRRSIGPNVFDILPADDATGHTVRERREAYRDILPVRAEIEPHGLHPQPVLFAVIAAGSLRMQPRRVADRPFGDQPHAA